MSEFLSQEKYDALAEECQLLKTEKRSVILERLAFAKSLGDLSENAEYHSAKEAQGKNEARIAQIEAILKEAVIVTARDDGALAIGSKVRLTKSDGEIREYQIVGNEEADFALGKISFESPLGSALMGKQCGDTVSLRTPRGEVSYVISALL